MRKLQILVLVLFLACAAAFGANEFWRRTTTDNTLPVISCPETPLVLSVGEQDPQVLLQDVTAWDEKDGDLTDHILVEGIGGHIQDNLTTVTYVVSDQDHHVVKQTRPVQYTDYRPPRFVLNQELRFSVGQAILLSNYVSAWDVIDGSLSGQVKFTSTGLNASVEGNYPLTLEVTNSMGDTSTLTLNLRIDNIQAGEPRVYLKQYLLYLNTGAPFSPMDYFSDLLGGDVDDLTVTSTVNTAVPGTYSVTYSCPGSNGTVGSTVLYVVVV